MEIRRSVCTPKKNLIQKVIRNDKLLGRIPRGSLLDLENENVCDALLHGRDPEPPRPRAGNKSERVSSCCGRSVHESDTASSVMYAFHRMLLLCSQKTFLCLDFTSCKKVFLRQSVRNYYVSKERVARSILTLTMDNVRSHRDEFMEIENRWRLLSSREAHLSLREKAVREREEEIRRFMASNTSMPMPLALSVSVPPPIQQPIPHFKHINRKNIHAFVNNKNKDNDKDYSRLAAVRPEKKPRTATTRARVDI